MTLTAIIWTVFSVGFGAVIADDKPKGWNGQLLTFIATSCLVWVAGVTVWIVVGRIVG